MPTYKLVLVGDGGVGKSTYIKRLLTGEFEKKWISTLGVEVHPLVFHTNYGPVRFNVSDCAGQMSAANFGAERQDRFAGLAEAYWDGADCAVLMASFDSKRSMKSLSTWHSRLEEKVGEIPFVVVHNKAELKERKYTLNRGCHAIQYFAGLSECPGQFDAHNEARSYNFSVSTKSCYHLYDPILNLLRRLSGRQDTERSVANAVSIKLVDPLDGPLVVVGTWVKNGERTETRVGDEEPVVVSR